MSKLTVKIAKEVVANTKGVELMSLLTLEAIIQVALLKYREALEEQIGEEELPIRFCTCCGKIMQQGYYVEEGWQYYCTEDCLKQSFTEKEILDFKMGEEGSENYWTSWL